MIFFLSKALVPAATYYNILIKIAINELIIST